MRNLKSTYKLCTQDLNKGGDFTDSDVDLSNIYIEVDNLYCTTERKKLVCELPTLKKEKSELVHAWRLHVEEIDGQQQENITFTLEFEIYN